MSFSMQEVEQIIQAAVQEAVGQVATQVTQETAQQAAKQVLQAAQETGGSLSADRKILEHTSSTEDTGTDEAVKGKTYVDSEMWGINKKSLVEKSLDFDRSKKGFELEREQISIGEERAKAAKVSTLQHVESMMGLLNVYAQIQSVADQSKFNAAVTEPVAPNTQDSGSGA